MNEKIDELEIKIVFQEDLLTKLDQTVAAQQQQILKLESKVKLLIERLTEFNQGQQQGDEEPPPHY